VLVLSVKDFYTNVVEDKCLFIQWMEKQSSQVHYLCIKHCICKMQSSPLRDSCCPILGLIMSLTPISNGKTTQQKKKVIGIL
jgi:hypothetical protein